MTLDFVIDFTYDIAGVVFFCTYNIINIDIKVFVKNILIFESAMLHHHVFTVAQNRQIIHWPQIGAICVFPLATVVSSPSVMSGDGKTLIFLKWNCFIQCFYRFKSVFPPHQQFVVFWVMGAAVCERLGFTFTTPDVLLLCLCLKCTLRTCWTFQLQK